MFLEICLIEIIFKMVVEFVKIFLEMLMVCFFDFVIFVCYIYKVWLIGYLFVMWFNYKIEGYVVWNIW